MDKHRSYVVTRLKKGDVKIFESIYNENYPSLVNYARRFVLSTEEARGAVQDVFIKIWENRETLSENIHLRNYLHTSVRNRCLDILKHRKNINHYLREKIKEFETDPDGNATGHEPLDAMITRELEERIIEAIDHLPDRCREVFILSRHKGMKYKEISEHLDISVKTVETHIAHALNSLRKTLEEYKFF